MKKRRRKYTEEFKEEAVKLILEQGYPISEAARNLGVHPNLLGKWKREYEDGEKYWIVLTTFAGISSKSRSSQRA